MATEKRRVNPKPSPTFASTRPPAAYVITGNLKEVLTKDFYESTFIGDDITFSGSGGVQSNYENRAIYGGVSFVPTTHGRGAVVQQAYTASESAAEDNELTRSFGKGTTWWVWDGQEKEFFNSPPDNIDEVALQTASHRFKKDIFAQADFTYSNEGGLSRWVGINQVNQAFYTFISSNFIPTKLLDTADTWTGAKRGFSFSSSTTLPDYFRSFCSIYDKTLVALDYTNAFINSSSPKLDSLGSIYSIQPKTQGPTQDSTSSYNYSFSFRDKIKPSQILVNNLPDGFLKSEIHSVVLYPVRGFNVIPIE